MAKTSDANLLESHIEKIVLGLCLAILIFVVVHWVAGSPRTVEVLDASGMSTVAVEPKRADEVLLQGAQRVRDINQRAPVPPLPVIRWGEKFDAVANRPFPNIVSLDGGSPLLPPYRPKAIDPNALPGLPELAAAVPPPTRPLIWWGFEVRKPDAGAPGAEELVCHGASEFGYGELLKKWEPKLRRVPGDKVVVLRVEVQVQTRAPNGPPASAEGAPAKLVSLPAIDNQGRPISLPKIPDYDGNNALEVRTAIDALAATNWQRYILTPPYWDIASPKGGWGTWRTHLPETPASRLEPVPGLAPEPAAPAAPAAPVTLGPGPTGAYGPGAPYGPGGAYGPGAPFGPGAPYGPGGAYGPAATPASPTGTETAGPVWVDTPTMPGTRATAIPDLARQRQAGMVMIAFHDTSLRQGVLARYRVRVVLVNPLLGHDAVQDRKRDSFPKEIASPWSEWSEEFSVENPTQFYLTGAMPPNRLRLAVFTQKLGQTVRDVFNIEPGMLIGGPSKITVAAPVTGLPTPVDFSTGCVAVELDLERTHVRRAPSGGALAVRTTSLLYLDEKGRLRKKVQVEDENSAEYKRLVADSGAP